MHGSSAVKPKRGRGVAHSRSGARKRVVNQPRPSLFGPTVLWDEHQERDASQAQQATGIAPSTSYLDEMATLCLAGDSIEVLEDDFRREMRIDVLKRAVGQVWPDSSPTEHVAERALMDQLGIELYLYHQELTIAGRERKWPIFVRMFGFPSYDAEFLVETGRDIMEERYKSMDVRVIN